jgi:hypothetical protein
MPLGWLIIWVEWLGLCLGVIVVDSILRKKRSRAMDSADLSDKRITPWIGVLVLGALLGTFLVPIYIVTAVMPLYFWFSYKRASAVLIGLLILIAIDIIIFWTPWLLVLIFWPNAVR